MTLAIEIQIMENQKNRTSVGQRLFRAVAILLTWIVAYLVYSRTSGGNRDRLLVGIGVDEGRVRA